MSEVSKTYAKIEEVFRQVGKPLAGFEFDDVRVRVPDEDMPSAKITMPGRRYVGCTQSALERRMREMFNIGRLTKWRRAGSAFVEYALPGVEPKMAAHTYGFDGDGREAEDAACPN